MRLVSIPTHYVLAPSTNLQGCYARLHLEFVQCLILISNVVRSNYSVTGCCGVVILIKNVRQLAQIIYRFIGDDFMLLTTSTVKLEYGVAL